MAISELQFNDWKQMINDDLVKIASVETEQEVIILFKKIAGQLYNFLKEMKVYMKKMQNYIDVNHSEADRKDEFRAFQQKALKNENMQEYALYKEIIAFLKQGYIILMNIRHQLVGDIVYNIGFNYSGKTYHIRFNSIEELFQYTDFSLSNRVSLTANNLARLELSLQDRINELVNTNKVVEVNDSLYTAIQHYRSLKERSGVLYRHRYYFNKNQKVYLKGGAGYDITDGNVWEVYNYMKQSKKINTFNDVLFHQLYETARKGNLPYYKGGDVFNEQDKFGGKFALTSMYSVYNTLMQLANAFSKSTNIKQIEARLRKIFIQQIPTDEELGEYVENEIDHLIGILTKAKSI